MKVTFTATVTQYTNFPFILKLLKHPFSKQSYYRFTLPAFSFWATVLTPFSEQAIASSFLQLFCYMTLSVCHPHLHGYHYILTTVIVWNPSTVRFSNNNRFAYYVGYSIKKWQVPLATASTNSEGRNCTSQPFRISAARSNVQAISVTHIYRNWRGLTIFHSYIIAIISAQKFRLSDQIQQEF